MSRNPFNIWNPGPESEILDVAFSAYAKHKTECDDIVRMICNGGTSFELDDDFCDADLKYIEKECSKHGVYVNLSLS